MMVSGGLHGDRGISWMSRKACMNVEGFHGCLGKLAWKFRNFLFGLVYCTYVSHWLFLIEWFIYRAVVLRSVPIKDPPFSFLSISFQSKSSSLYSSFSLFLSLHIFSFLFISLPFSSFLFLSLFFCHRSCCTTIHFTFSTNIHQVWYGLCSNLRTSVPLIRIYLFLSRISSRTAWYSMNA